MDSILAQINSQLDKVLIESELEDCFLIEMKNTDGKVEIFMDADEGMTFPKCRTISRQLEAFIDESQILGEKYTIEVSSPGAKSPLKYLRQYHQHIGRRIKICFEDDKNLKGKFISIDGQTIHLETSEGKGKKKVIEQHEIEFDKIDKSYILLAF